MANENPIQGLYDEYIKIIQGSTIKYTYLADTYETLEIRKYVDAYLDAYYQRDDFSIYDYSIEEYKIACTELGLIEDFNFSNYYQNQSKTPKYIKTKLLENRRKTIIESYEEKNNYYRMLNGYPDIEDNEFIYVDYNIAITYGIDPTIPVHLIEDQMGTHYITALESIGYLDQLIEENPDKEYLKFVGSKRIDIIDARRAKNFEILYLDSSITESIRNIFSTVYEQCREYFMTTIYIYDYRRVIDYYDRFIGLCIMVMALQQLTARSIVSSLDRDFFDTHAVQALYEMYDIPFYSKLDEKTQKALCQNINMLIQNKGTNKVIYDIASLLGFSRIDIYKYYLMKEHRMDNLGNPIFVTKQEFNEDTGEYEEVYDYEAMYDVYFQKVQLNEYDYHEALEDPTNRVSYESVTENDPFWIEDDELYQEVWESEYNYKESKYLGVTVSYKLSEFLYENIMLLRMIFDMKDSINDITLKLPSITGDTPVSLFDTIVLLCALTSKKYGLNGEIVSKPSQVIQVLDHMERLYNPYETMNETFAFNFDWLNDKHYQEVKSELYSYMTELEIKEFEEYISILTINTWSTKEQKIEAINKMYSNIRGLSRFMAKKMQKSKSVEEYRTVSRFFRAMFYSKETSEMFEVKDGVGGTIIPSTFQEYLLYSNASLNEFLDTVDRNECHLYIDHIITRLETIIDNLDYLYIINASTSAVQDVLIDLVRFFKSYTTDMIGLNIVYIFDFIPDNLLRLFDRISTIKKTLGIKDTIDFGYADTIKSAHANINIREKFWNLKETMVLHSLIKLYEKFTFGEILAISKEIQFSDIIKLVEDIHIHATIRNKDLLSLTDKIHGILAKVYISDNFKLLEEVIESKFIQTLETLSLYDASKVNKRIEWNDSNMKFKDACIVVSKE